MGSEARAEGRTLYVATDGADRWSGTMPEPNAARTDGPLATLARARDAVRALLAAGHEQDVTVLVRGGTYRLHETVVFTLTDSGRDGQTITYAAYRDETPVFNSGHPITGWTRLETPPAGLPPKARGKVWAADVSAVRELKRRHPGPVLRWTDKAPHWRFLTLYDGGTRLSRARSAGFSPTRALPRGAKNHSTVPFPKGAIRNWAGLRDAELVIIPGFFWVMNILPLASVDEAAGVAKTAVDGTYPLGKNGMTDRHTAWVENVLEALDEPGEWVLDSAKARLYLWPRGEKPGDTIVAPTLTELVRVEGKIDTKGPTDVPVRNLVFRGLTFTHGDRLGWHGKTGWGLQHDWEMFDSPTALVRFRGAENCAIEDCHFVNSGHTAVRLDLYCQKNRIVGNHIEHTGGVGVLLAGYGPGTKDANKHNEVANNYIHHIGELYPGSGGIFAWQSGHNRIAHNHIHHVPYTGILVTCRAGRGKPSPGECTRTNRHHELDPQYARLPWDKRERYLHGRQNLVTRNEIHNAMEVLGDGNCIYISGTGAGNRVAENYCHDCTGEYMNAVIRCDDDQHGTVIEGNVMHRTGGHGEGIISKGSNDIVNNVIADMRPTHAHRGYIVFPYGSVKGSTIERNILYSRRKGQILYHHNLASRRRGGPPRLRDAKADRNLYWCTDDPKWAAGHFAEERPHGIETHSIAADPLFVDPDGGDFRFRAGSSAVELGIEPIDTSQAGLEPPYRKRFIGKRITTRIRPVGHVLRKPVEITIETDRPGAEIRYTLDGSEPTRQATRYSGPFAFGKPGTVRAKAFAEGATDLVGASVTFASPPLPIVEDFESLSVGSETPRATTSEENVRQTIRVTDEQAADGQRSLKFVDGPGQKHPFNPHLFYRLAFTEGRMMGRFGLRIDENTTFYYQWRDYQRRGFRRGPTVKIDPDGKLVHDGKTLMTVPLGQWIGFEVTCELGDAAKTFDMTVRLSHRSQPRVFHGLACESGFETLDWLGFVPNGERQTVIYVDNIELQPVE